MARCRVEFTNLGRERLETSLREYREAIEEAIGENALRGSGAVIEATAADVDRAVSRIRDGFLRTSSRNLEIWTQLAFATGALLVVGGLLWPAVTALKLDPVQGAVAGAGALLLLASLIAIPWLHVRSRARMEELQGEVQRILMEREFRRAADSMVSIARLKIDGTQEAEVEEPAEPAPKEAGAPRMMDIWMSDKDSKQSIGLPPHYAATRLGPASAPQQPNV